MRVTTLSLLTLLQTLTVLSLSVSPNAQTNELFKRKGGGGGGRSGGSSGSSGVSSGGSTGARTGSGSSTGGATSAGSGVRPSYGSGGAYYGGGARTPYAAGGTSARGGLSPITLLPIAGLGIFGGAWLYGAYLYSYPRPYGFYNSTSRRNETKPVDCLCQQYSECGCDTPDDDSFLNSVVGNGSYSSLNSSLVRVADVNGTSTILLNGTLPNGTTAAGGTDDDDDSSDSGALKLGQQYGWAVIAAAVASAMLSL